MNKLNKIGFSAAVFLNAFALTASGGASASTSATQTVTPFELANAICSSGNVAGSLLSFPATASDQAIALGEASRQVTAGTCAATQNAIDVALQALINANPGNTRLMTAYNAQKASGNGAQGNGIKGLYVDEETAVGETLVKTSASESVSSQ